MSPYCFDWEYTCTADPGRARRGGAAPCWAGKEKETAATKSEYALGHAYRKSVESRILKKVLESIQSECLRLRVSQSSESIADSFLKGETANWQSVHSELSQIGDRISRKSKVLRNLVLQTKLLCSADEISGEVTACSHCLQPGFFRVRNYC